MDREYFETEIEKVIEKYSDLEYALEMCNTNVKELSEELFTKIHDENNIESVFVDNANSKICKANDSTKSLLQKYFDEVGYIYEQNNNDTDIEFCEENRNKLIEMNLKCVVKIAKAYRNMGVDFEDLISAGNEGLCVAFDKYKPNKKQIREKLMLALEEEQDEIHNSWVEENIKPQCKYGKLKKLFDKTFTKPSYNKDFIIKWINSNIKDASFNSVAMMWVQAWIRAEITNNSRLIKKPLSEINKERDKNSKKEVYLNIDAPVSGDKGLTIGNVLNIEDNSQTELDIDDSFKIVHDSIATMMTGLDTRHKRIVMQRFGIGLVRAMKPAEIAEREKISKARVSQILRYALNEMQDNCVKYSIDAKTLYDIINKTKEIF